MSFTCKEPKLRFPEFRGEWVEKKLGDISSLTSSKRIYLSDYTESGIPFYRGKEISEIKCGQIPKDILYISEKAYQEYKLKFGVPKIGDILITAVGTLGNVLQIKDNVPFYFKDGNLIWIKDIKENSDFLEILLDVNNRDINKSSIGSTQRALTMVELRKLQFNFPSKLEQKKIASFLTAVNAKIEQLVNKEKLLEKYKKSVMQKLFSGELRFKADDGSEYPEWEEKKLGEVSDVRDGTHDSPKYHSEGFPLITSKNLMKDGTIDFQNVNLIKEDDYKTINKRSGVSKGDILFGMIGTIGNPVIVYECDFAIKNVALIKQKTLLKNSFLIHYLKSPKIEQQFYEQNTGGTQKFIALGVIRDLLVDLPSLPEQTKIAHFLSAIDEKLLHVKAQTLQTQQFKKALLQQMFV